MKAKLIVAFAPFAILALPVGCDTPSLPKPPAPAPVAEPVAATPTPAPVPQDVGVNGTVAPPMEKPVTKTPRKFGAHDAIQGRRSKAAGGYLGAVGNANFYARHQMVINSITEALALYNAEHGDWPKSHEEFMDKIIKFNNIQLPKLDDPVEYIFVPEDGAKGLQIRLKPDFDGDIWPPGANPADATDEEPAEYEQPNQPNQPADASAAAQPPAEQPPQAPASEPAPRAIGVEGVGGAAGVAPLDLQ